MPKVSQLQEGFNGGEFSPMAQGRASSERYKTGLAACLNYIPTLQGPLVRRPATKLSGISQTVPAAAAAPPVVIPFIFSQTQAYMLEFGQQYINFYANNSPVTTSAPLYAVFGSYTGEGNHIFYGTRPTYSTKLLESITASSVILPGQLSVSSPYNIQDVADIKWAQSADTVYLTHPSYPTFKLQRYASFDWRLVQVYHQDGPYLDYNSYAQTGDSVNITLQPGGTGWTPGFDTVLQTGPHTKVNSATAVNSGVVGSPILITTNFPNTYVSGMKVVVKNIVGTQEANNYIGFGSSVIPYWSIEVLTPTTFTLLGSQFAHPYVSGGDVYPALFNGADVSRVVGLQQGVVENAGQRVWGYVTSYEGDASEVGFYLDGSNTLLNTSVVIFWQLGCYFGNTQAAAQLETLPPISALVGGYLGSSSFPANVCFHQDRLCFSGSLNYPQQIDGSVIGAYEQFSPSTAIGSAALQVTDANAFQFTLNSTDVNALQWMKSTAQGLVSASYSNEWCLTPSSQSASISPTNVNAQQTSFFGAANVDAVMAGNAVLYIQRAQRKLREMNYFFQLGTYRSSDLTEISEHITLPTITKLAVQKETQPLVWAVRSDGALTSMTYNRDDISINAAWARHILGGRSDAAGSPPIVSSIASIPDPTNTYDQIWMVVQRYLGNGSTVYTVEYLTNIYNDSFLQENAFQGDCGFTHDAPVPFAVTGIADSGSVLTVSLPSHGFSNGAQVKCTSVIGLNLSTTDINGNVTITSLMNNQQFLVTAATTNTFGLTTLQGANVSTAGYSPWVSGGQFRLMLKTITIPGFGVMAGETLNVLADGGNHPPCLVSSTGHITLQYLAATVQVGYAFPSQGQLLRSNQGSAQGASIGSTRRVNRAAAMLHDVGDWAWGMSFTNLISYNFVQADVQQADIRTPLFSGLIREGVEAPYDFENQLCFQQNSMLPGMVQAITLFFEENDV